MSLVQGRLSSVMALVAQCGRLQLPSRVSILFSILETVQAGGIPTSACFRIPLSQAGNRLQWKPVLPASSVPTGEPTLLG